MKRTMRLSACLLLLIACSAQPAQQAASASLPSFVESVTPQPDGATEIVVSGRFRPEQPGGRVQSVNLRERLEQAAGAVCGGSNYQLAPSDSVGNVSNSTGLKFTLKGTVRCAAQDRLNRLGGLQRTDSTTAMRPSPQPPQATGPVQIWSYAFVTFPTDSPQPISGDGSAIFKSENGWLDGPMWSHDRTGYRLRFAISGKSATAVLTTEKDPSAKIQLEGPVSETPESDGKGCSVVARLTDGVRFVLVQNYAEKCS
jgi:hypothetical protein